MTKDLSEPLSSVYGSGGYAFSRYNPALKFGTPLTPAQESRTTLAQVGTRNAAAAPASCIASAPTRATLRTLHRASCVLSSRRLPRRRPCGRPVPYLCYRYSPPPHTLQVAAPVPVHWSSSLRSLAAGLRRRAERPKRLLRLPDAAARRGARAGESSLSGRERCATCHAKDFAMHAKDALAMHAALASHSPCVSRACRACRACQACAVCGAVHWCSALVRACSITCP